MNEQQQQQIQLYDNSTKSLSFIVSSSLSPVRTRTVINVIYISGIAFMIGVFVILLWINLYSRRCWCWHDTLLVQRFNRQWLIRRSMSRNNDASGSKQHRQGKLTNDDELLP